jgi:hypothetical protein
MSPEIGQRVVAMESADDKVVRIFGYGVYETDVPCASLFSFGPEDDDMDAELRAFLESAGGTTPQIRLDNGQTVLGSQCHWGPEGEAFKTWVGERTIEVVPFPEIDEVETDGLIC